MSKVTKIISDLRSFFAKDDETRAIKCIMGVMERISIDATELLTDFIENNSVAHMLRNMYIYKQVS